MIYHTTGMNESTGDVVDLMQWLPGGTGRTRLIVFLPHGTGTTLLLFFWSFIWQKLWIVPSTLYFFGYLRQCSKRAEAITKG